MKYAWKEMLTLRNDIKALLWQEIDEKINIRQLRTFFSNTYTSNMTLAMFNANWLPMTDKKNVGMAILKIQNPLC